MCERGVCACEREGEWAVLGLMGERNGRWYSRQRRQEERQEEKRGQNTMTHKDQRRTNRGVKIQQQSVSQPAGRLCGCGQWSHTHTHTHTRTHKQATVGGIRVGKACVRACDVLLCVCVCFCFLFLILPRVRSGTKHSLPSRQDPTTTNNVQRSKKNK